MSFFCKGQEWKSEKETCIIAFLYVRNRAHYCGILAKGELVDVEIRDLCTTLARGSFALQSGLHTFTNEEASLIEATFDAKVTRAVPHDSVTVTELSSPQIKDAKASAYVLRSAASIPSSAAEEIKSR